MCLYIAALRFSAYVLLCKGETHLPTFSVFWGNGGEEYLNLVQILDFHVFILKESFEQTKLSITQTFSPHTGD
jgi:hypothetical protein